MMNAERGFFIIAFHPTSTRRNSLTHSRVLTLSCTHTMPAIRCLWEGGGRTISVGAGWLLNELEGFAKKGIQCWKSVTNDGFLDR